MPAAYRIALGRQDGQSERHSVDPHPNGLRLIPACHFAVLAATAVLLHACATASPPRPAAVGPRVVSGKPIEIRVQVEERGTGSRVRVLPLEEYVAGCVDAEVGRLDLDAAPADRMRRVQAILCRTYAVANLGRHESEGFDLCSTTHCQLYRRLPPESLTARLAHQAAAGTAGLVATFNGRPIQALYHANCGGRTSPADAVWGGRPEPYLTAVADPECGKSGRWLSKIGRDDLHRILRKDPRTDPGSRLDKVSVTARDDGGRATAITISGAQTRSARGEAFRTIVSASLGANVLRSTWFEVRRQADEFVFEGRGSGHGAGLCQAGALRQARKGRSEAEILTYFFPGITLLRLDALR